LYHLYAKMSEVALEIVISELKEAVDWNHGLGHVGTKSLETLIKEQIMEDLYVHLYTSFVKDATYENTRVLIHTKKPRCVVRMTIPNLREFGVIKINHEHV